MKKRCTKCGVRRTLAQFHRARVTRDGFQTQCKHCRNPYNRKQFRTYYYENHTLELARSRARYLKESRK